MARNVKTVSYSLPVAIYEQVEKNAEAAGISRSSYVTMVLKGVFSEAQLDGAREVFKHGNTHAEWGERDNG